LFSPNDKETSGKGDRFGGFLGFDNKQVERCSRSLTTVITNFFDWKMIGRVTIEWIWKWWAVTVIVGCGDVVALKFSIIPSECLHT
jgi:hypothetical protein